MPNIKKPPVLTETKMVQVIEYHPMRRSIFIGKDNKRNGMFEYESDIENDERFEWIAEAQRDADVEYYKDYVLLPKEETIKKIESILAKYISDAKCQVFHSHDDVFLATQIYNELVKESN